MIAGASAASTIQSIDAKPPIDGLTRSQSISSPERIVLNEVERDLQTFR
jgi:hypothetical protein